MLFRYRAYRPFTARIGIEGRWDVFPLHPEVPEEGMDLAGLFAAAVDGAWRGAMELMISPYEDLVRLIGRN